MLNMLLSFLWCLVFHNYYFFFILEIVILTIHANFCEPRHISVQNGVLLLQVPKVVGIARGFVEKKDETQAVLLIRAPCDTFNSYRFIVVFVFKQQETIVSVRRTKTNSFLELHVLYRAVHQGCD